MAIVFDGRCGICTRMARWLERRDTHRRLRLLPSQQAGVLLAYRITREQADRELWAIDGASGARYAGAAAANRALQALGGGWAVLSRLYQLAPLRRLEDLGYRWFARHRPWFNRWGIRPACEEPGADCRDDA